MINFLAIVKDSERKRSLRQLLFASSLYERCERNDSMPLHKYEYKLKLILSRMKEIGYIRDDTNQCSAYKNIVADKHDPNQEIKEDSDRGLDFEKKIRSIVRAQKRVPTLRAIFQPYQKTFLNSPDWKNSGFQWTYKEWSFLHALETLYSLGYENEFYRTKSFCRLKKYVQEQDPDYKASKEKAKSARMKDHAHTHTHTNTGNVSYVSTAHAGASVTWVDTSATSTTSTF